MSVLACGQETEDIIDCLLSLTKIDSERKIKALKYYFVKGITIKLAAEMVGLPQPNLTEVIDTLNKVAENCEKYHEIRVSQFSNSVLARLNNKYTS